MIDESNVHFMNEDIQGGYSQVQLLYFINNCVGIEVQVRDYERGINVLNLIVDKLKDIDLSEDIKYSEKYDEEVEAYLKWKKEHEQKEKVEL